MKHFFYKDVLFTWKFSSTILLLLFAKKWIWFPVFKFCLFGELVDWRGRDHGDMIFPSHYKRWWWLLLLWLLYYICVMYTHTLPEFHWAIILITCNWQLNQADFFFSFASSIDDDDGQTILKPNIIHTSKITKI